MQIRPVEVLPVERLRHNPENPKHPLGLKYKRGLRASLDRFGFAGLLVVAADADGTFEVLDGNTRLEELSRLGVESVPCVVYRNMDREERRAFVLAHDRHRKEFNEEAVLGQLHALAEAGRDVKVLATLSGKDNLERLLAESSMAGPRAAAAGPADAPPAMGSMVLYGPAADLAAVRETLKGVRGRLSAATKAAKVLAEVAQFVDWDDERVLAVLLASARRFAEVSSEGA